MASWGHLGDTLGIQKVTMTPWGHRPGQEVAMVMMWAWPLPQAPPPPNNPTHQWPCPLHMAPPTLGLCPHTRWPPRGAGQGGHDTQGQP